MADNIEEQDLHSPTNTQSDNSSDNIIPTIGTETINQNQETGNMEVHAHDLYKAPGNGWKHYIFEFIMLFLAVFCGFLAENFRETEVEHKKEKEFMQSMIDDLKTDTVTGAKVLERLNISMNKIDTATRLYTNHNNLTDSQVIAIASLIRSGGASRPVFFTNRTSLQLKYSGSMRLIRKKIVSDSLIAYWNNIEKIENAYNRIDNFRIDAVKLGSKILNFLPQDSAYFNHDISPLLDNSPTLFGEYIHSWWYIRQSYRFGYYNYIKNQINSAESLIELIRKEYHIE